MARRRGTTLADFDRDAKRAHERVVAGATETVRAFAQQAFQDLSWDAKQVSGYGSPVASGRLAGSTRLGVGAVDGSAEPADPTYQYGQPLPPRTINNVPASSIALKLRGFRLGQKIFISNSVPYIRKIEVGGHSWQTPEGIFEPTFRRLLRIFKAPLARFRNG